MPARHSAQCSGYRKQNSKVPEGRLILFVEVVDEDYLLHSLPD